MHMPGDIRYNTNIAVYTAHAYRQHAPRTLLNGVKAASSGCCLREALRRTGVDESPRKCVLSLWWDHGRKVKCGGKPWR